MVKGRIINLNGGVYKVLLDDGNVISVKARGKLRFSKKSIIRTGTLSRACPPDYLIRLMMVKIV